MRDPSWTPDWMDRSADGPLVVQAHTGAIAALCLNGDGHLLLTGGDDQALRRWYAPALSEVRAMSGDPGLVCGVAITGSGKWSASCALRMLPQDMTGQLWDLGSGLERRRLRGPRDNLVSVALSPAAARWLRGAATARFIYGRSIRQARRRSLRKVAPERLPEWRLRRTVRPFFRAG